MSKVAASAPQTTREPFHRQPNSGCSLPCIHFSLPDRRPCVSEDNDGTRVPRRRSKSFLVLTSFFLPARRGTISANAGVSWAMPGLISSTLGSVVSGRTKKNKHIKLTSVITIREVQMAKGCYRLHMYTDSSMLKSYTLLQNIKCMHRGYKYNVLVYMK